MTRRTTTRALLGAAALLGLVTMSPAPSARADAWCARPVWAHEWGVHVYATDGAPVASFEGLPEWFHTGDTPSATVPPAVRNLPADSGMRRLPVVHFYSWDEASVPVAVEVGFTTGPASAWFPAVDTRRLAAPANSEAARKARAALADARLERQAGRSTAALPLDPTKQLVWDRLELTKAPAASAYRTDEPWITKARALPARWVNRASESERFVFYEAASAEPLPLRIRRAKGYAPGHRAYVLENRGAHAVHDVLLTHEERGESYVFGVETLPVGGQARFVLEGLVVEDRRAATWDRLRAALTDGVFKAWPAVPYPTAGPCAMGRDPAIPVERAEGHRLFADEVELLLSYWGERFFDQPGTTVVWREDAATLDAVMPLSIYTDMFHYVRLRRAGLALWEHVVLP